MPQMNSNSIKKVRIIEDLDVGVILDEETMKEMKEKAKEQAKEEVKEDGDECIDNS